MLSNDAPERRIAAAIVLGELKTRTPGVIKALVASLEQDGAAVPHALQALTDIGAAAKAVDAILPLTASRDATTREAAVDALISAGDGIVPKLEARLATAAPEERRELERVLARLGGKEAFSALLAGIEEAGEDEAAAAAVAMRQHARDADARQRRDYMSQLQKLLAVQRKKQQPNQATVKAAIKMLGFLEDERAIATLLEHATSKKQSASVRQEALIALRFASKGKAPEAKTINALVTAAQDDDRLLSQTALITLAGLELPARASGRLDPLLEHEDIERVRFVIDMLAHRKSLEAAHQLVDVLAHKEVRRAKLAAGALRERKDAAPLLAGALCACADAERARLIAQVLRPFSGELGAAHTKKLLDTALARMESGDRGWDAAFDVAREANAKQTFKALRALYERLRRKKSDKATFALRVLCKSDVATDDDRYQLASRVLSKSHKDTSLTARRGDEALEMIGRLLQGGYDVARALRSDRSVDLDSLYYVGFHFIEQQHPVGEDLLRQVADKGGKKKIGKMAKNKLELQGLS